MWCHLLLLMPIAIAGLLWFLPWTTAVPMVAVLVAGTATVIAVAWRATRQPAAIGRESMIGRGGEAVSDVNPEGLVRLHGELWLAAAWRPVSRGQRVEVVEVSGAKLLVRPWS
jgi:membrane-bound serine protease (ClpP class)